MNSATTCFQPWEIESLLDGDLTPEQLVIAEEHLSGCASCRSVVEFSIGPEQWWDDVQQSLGPQNEDQYSRNESGQSVGEDRAPTSALLELLGPTDDPAMLGRIGSYEITGILGQGGMGAVFKGFDRSLNRYVAIKMLLPHLAASGAARQRFAREGQAVAAVVDNHVMAIHCVDEWRGIPYLVMTYSRGVSLQKRLGNQGSLDLREILRIGMQAAKGLSAAHAQGIVHRDVKPANIFLDEHVERVQLMDFGLARAVDDASLTRSGMLAGTPQFMSPEQARAEKVDQRSDLFSLGAVLYAMCVGRAPFRAESSYSVLRLIIDTEPRPIREINPDIPDWLCRVIGKLMSKRADDRYQTAAEVAELLGSCLAHVQQPTDVPLPNLSLPPRSKPVTPANGGVPFFRSPGFLRFVALLFFVVFGTLIVVEFDKGTLRIESELDNVSVRVMQGEDVVSQLTVSRAGSAVRVAAGRYVVEIDGETDGITIKGGTVTLTRGSSKTASIVYDREPVHRDATELLHGRFLGVVEKIPQAKGGAAEPQGAASCQMRAFIDGSMFKWVQVGSPAKIKIDALPTVILSGRVTAVFQVIDPPRRNNAPGATVEAIITFDTQPKSLIAGMTGEIDIEQTVLLAVAGQVQEPPQTLLDVVNAFNQEQTQTGRGLDKDLPLLSVDEVVYSVLVAMKAGVSLAPPEMQEFRDIAEKRLVHDGWHFVVAGIGEGEHGDRSQGWSIRLVLQRRDSNDRRLTHIIREQSVRHTEEEPLWRRYGVTSTPVAPMTAKVLEWIGLHLNPITNERFRDKNVLANYEGGLDVTIVRTDDGPAGRADIHEVDIVVGLQGHKLINLRQLDVAIRDAVSQIEQGATDSLQFDVLRNGETVRVNVPFPAKLLKTAETESSGSSGTVRAVTTDSGEVIELRGKREDVNNLLEAIKKQ